MANIKNRNTEKALDEVFSEKNRKEWIKDIDNKKHKSKKRLFLSLAMAGGVLLTVLLFKDNIVVALVEANIPGVSEKLQTFLPEKVEKISYEELEKKLSLAEKDLTDALGMIDEVKSQNSDLTKTIEELTPYKTKVDEFIEHKSEWDSQVAMENPQEFIKHYETMYPEVAKEVYSVLKADAIQTEEEQEYIKTINGLDNKKAAALIETLLDKNSSLVLNILDNLSVDKNTGILSSLKPEVAAKITVLRDPFKEETN